MEYYAHHMKEIVLFHNYPYKILAIIALENFVRSEWYNINL